MTSQSLKVILLRHINAAFPVPDVKDALDKGWVHKRRAPADGPWVIISFRSPIVVELKDIASGRKQIVHIDRIVPCLHQETEFDAPADAAGQLSQSPAQSPSTTQERRRVPFLIEHQTSSASQDVDSQSRSGRVIRRPMRYR